MRLHGPYALQTQVGHAIRGRLVLPLALTLFVAAPVIGQTDVSSDGKACSAKHKQSSRGREPKQTSSHTDEGYYGTINVNPDHKEVPADGYYSAVPAWKASAAPVTDSPEQKEPEAKSPSPPPFTSAVVPLANPVAPALPATKSLAFNSGITIVAVPTLATAIAAFDKHEFLVALKQFQKLHDQGMCTDVVHYYIARCYQQNSQIAAALQNYEAVLAKSRNMTLRGYATTAYAQLTKYSHHRTYEGQGNNFQRYSRPGPASGGGGGGGGG